MSNMETNVSQILGPMMLHGWTNGLPPRFQAKLAAWAVKTALVGDYLHAGRRVVPESEYERLYLTKQPHDGQVAWIAHRATFVDHTGRTLAGQIIKETLTHISIPGDGDPVRAEARFKEWTSQGMGGYWFTITCGHFVCLVFGHNFPTRLNVDVNSGGLQNVLQRIWPVSPHLNWPPPAAVETIGGLGALHRAFRERPK